MTGAGPQNEREHIERVYGERSRSIPADRYSAFDPANLFIIQQRERAVLAALKRHGMQDLSGTRVLDVGCGTGGELRNLVRYGADPSLLHGIDILGERIAAARAISPNMHFSEGSARELPFADSTFDLVTQFTVFSSVPDGGLRARIAQEMIRVLRPGGFVLWYDLRYDNPRNPDVHGSGTKDVRSLFPGCSYDFRAVTLAPPLTRALASLSWTCCLLLEAVPFLRSHYLAIIGKPSKTKEELT